jgi:uncharacterized protein YbjT (DUF2867 family)
VARVFVIGSTGRVGSRILLQLAAQGHQTIGLHRRTSQAAGLRSQGCEPVLGDLTTISRDQLAELMSGCDTVIFAAGAPEDGTRAADLVDGDGLVLAAEAAAQAGVRRFLHVSAFPDAWRDRRMPSDFEHYMRVKRSADVYLAGTDLDWVIVRPGTLAALPGTGRVRLGPAIPYGDVSRDDVAAVFAALVNALDVTRQIVELTSGDTQVVEAVDALATDRFYPQRPPSKAGFFVHRLRSSPLVSGADADRRGGAGTLMRSPRPGPP